MRTSQLTWLYTSQTTQNLRFFSSIKNLNYFYYHILNSDIFGIYYLKYISSSFLLFYTIKLLLDYK